MQRTQASIVSAALAATIASACAAAHATHLDRPTAQAAPAAHDVYAGYLDHADLGARLRALAAESQIARVATYGTSGAGRELWVLTLAADHELAANRPALLITAGLDGRHAVGTDVAVRLAERLVREHAALLEHVTVHVIPLANPDGAMSNRGALNRGHVGTLRALDRDRDGLLDEDAPSDLDGDGALLSLRLVPDLAHTPTHVIDATDPRLLRPADLKLGEVATHVVLPEALDADGDGAFGEDGPDGVDLDRNFMHLWPEHGAGAGPYQLCESESLALATFVLEHRHITWALTFGRHDSIVNPLGSDGVDINREVVTGIDKGDAELYAELSKLFRDTTGQTRAPKADLAGSFHAWAYAQRGVIGAATVVWGRPEPVEAEAPAEEEALPVEGAVDESIVESTDEGTPVEEAAAVAADDEEAEVPAEKPRGGDTADEERAWLTYSDSLGGAGFVPWRAFEHPTLGAVEIGGFVPGFQMNPPAAELDALADKQLAFVVALLERRANVAVRGPQVRRLTDGLYEVRLALVNEGRLPTTTAMGARARPVLPTVVRLELAPENVLAGALVEQVWRLAAGARHEQVWTLRVPAGTPLEIALLDDRYGDRSITFTADETTTPTIAPRAKELR
jgi:hypothetical protein